MTDEIETRRLIKKAHALLDRVNLLLDRVEASLSQRCIEKKAA